MSTTSNEDTKTTQEPIFDPFPEPSGYPSGWDISEITPNPQPAPADSTEDTSES